MRYLLEISVESAQRAKAAERGGADRIELCGSLSVGGLSPDAQLIEAVRDCVSLPVFAMVRPRAGNFDYSPEEFESMKREIVLVQEMGMDGVVLGIVRDKRVDLARTSELVALARPLPVTFHRAFDTCMDLRTALDEVVEAGCARILTSGGASTAVGGKARLAELVQEARSRVVILPGGGITAANVLEVARDTEAREFHAALGSLLPFDRDTGKFEEEVAKLANTLCQDERSERRARGRRTRPFFQI